MCEIVYGVEKENGEEERDDGWYDQKNITKPTTLFKKGTYRKL